MSGDAVERCSAGKRETIGKMRATLETTCVPAVYLRCTLRARFSLRSSWITIMYLIRRRRRRERVVACEPLALLASAQRCGVHEHGRRTRNRARMCAWPTRVYPEVLNFHNLSLTILVVQVAVVVVVIAVSLYDDCDNASVAFSGEAHMWW